MKLLFYFVILHDFPTLTGKSSQLKMNPGISVVPTPSVLTSLVHIRVADPVSYSALVDETAAFLSHYQSHTSGGMFANCEDLPGFLNPRRSCRFNLDASGPCNLKNGFGYFRGQPCFAVKLNRIYGWLPSPISNSTGVRLKCEGLTETDVAYLGKVCYYDMDSLRHHNAMEPPLNWCDRDFGVFHSMFYPFLNQANYHSPIVFVQFRAPKRYVVIWIKCYALANNIEVNIDRNEGSMVFQILVD
ncbi:hypothetical protein EG68_00543 [Paragonimus skrjabini miyazakii]|uniref:Sodium/potassium-transporting ATPase subunit beta n=1 Tax=Paragonimus skrjabini miyazakii TaxID=59628 RepID=A0A8S9Z9G8_9TREM|nr:hypothetical protein EG68_00543 [Paragonimus skrjabini miyazakii]